MDLLRCVSILVSSAALVACGGGGDGDDGDASLASVRFVNASIEADPLLFDLDGQSELLRRGEVGRILRVSAGGTPSSRTVRIVKGDGQVAPATFAPRPGPQLVAFSGRIDLLTLPLPQPDPALAFPRVRVGFGGASQRDNLDVYLLQPGAPFGLADRTLIRLRYGVTSFLELNAGQTYQLVVTSLNQPEVVFFRTQSFRVDSAEPAGLLTIPLDAGTGTAMLVATMSGERTIQGDP